MSWSTALYEKIIQTGPGLLLSRMKLGKRRVVLFPRDILADYFSACSLCGKEKSLYTHALDWSSLFCHARFPSWMGSLSPEWIVNHFLRHVWKKTGGITHIFLTRKGNLLSMRLTNELITQKMGPNVFTQGSIAGILQHVYRRKLAPASTSRDGESATYSYLLSDEKIIPNLSVKKENTLIFFQKSRGLDLQHALQNGLITAGPQNALLFRQTPLLMMENTFLHMIGNEKLELESISKASRNYFFPLIEKESSLSQRVVLLKSLLQSFGWGVPIFYFDENDIRLTIQNSPLPLVGVLFNPLFYLKTIEGYLCASSEEFFLKKWDAPPDGSGRVEAIFSLKPK